MQGNLKNKGEEQTILCLHYALASFDTIIPEFLELIPTIICSAKFQHTAHVSCIIPVLFKYCTQPRAITDKKNVKIVLPNEGYSRVFNWSNESVKYPCDHCDYQATFRENFLPILNPNMMVSSIPVINVILKQHTEVIQYLVINKEMKASSILCTQCDYKGKY